jgi:hypothetical protein
MERRPSALRVAAITTESVGTHCPTPGNPTITIEQSAKEPARTPTSMGLNFLISPLEDDRQLACYGSGRPRALLYVLLHTPLPTV